MAQQSENGPKKVLSARIKPANRAGLDVLAQGESGKISSFVDMAIEEFLARRLGNEFSPKSIFSLDSEDIERITPVVKAIGAPISLEVFISIVGAQRAASKV